ncbi:uncharacterized protein [Halyomorpha halys]|uniref:uncharacterized protein isoform X2 n=1 Tax=Halyomorpha halys TaxID=286706 RepID=UPI0006D4D286|nr:uncharacterized protein LOC106679021 isoform X2 [Halyomorpha halys]
MGLMFSIQSNRNVFIETKSTIHLIQYSISNSFVKLHTTSSRRAHILNRREKNGIPGLLGASGGMFCSATAVLLSWPWKKANGQEEPMDLGGPSNEERKLAKILPPQDERDRLFEKLGYAIFIFIAFCMIIEVFLMDDEQDGPTPSSSSDS